ncbi:MAG: helix-turn-helix domain-containing protein [Treponema sp.]|jgi:two-component system response regulator YesN|nr:helix-turn-helix domain-containing protein [Treponema sp.]
MYKVFLVEDEIVVREGIRNSIPWDETAYTLAGEAPDGEMALSMIQDIKPDILITDIRMPFMDGLALSRIVKKTLPWIKIIILSGHDEFEYAREAISLGVEEYLLKPLSSREMLRALDKIAKRIDEEKQSLLSIENLKAQVRSSALTLRDKWLSDFVNGKISPADAAEQAGEFGVDLLARSYIAALVGIAGLGEGEAQAGSVRTIIDSVMGQYGGSIWFPENEKRFVLIIKSDQSGGSGLLQETAYTAARAIKHEAERGGCVIAAGIGVPVERLGEINRSYSTALRILDYETANGLAQIADSSLLPEGEGLFDPAGLLNIDGDLFFTKIKYAAKKDIDSIVAEYTAMLGNSFGENPVLVYFLFGEIIVAASKIVESLGGDIKAIAPFSLKQEDIQHIAASRDVFADKIKSLLAAAIEFRDSRTAGRYQSVIVRAREYIDQHFSEAGLSLYSTAAHVGISPNHLSTVFAQETGENFIEYLTRVRIERAKQLLKNTAMKSASIAYETGFSDPHYFSSIFKKNTGMSPRDYRANAAASTEQ